MDIARSDIVKSIAGRDKGKYFFVLEIEDEFLLLADGKTYAYAEGLWLLKNGATKQDTPAILAALPEADKYAVLRPTCALAGIITAPSL